ncbi:MAG TPA: cupin domain-containing protein [Usitatibacter sp.]|jgi:quercetin dioxygenase-like cupin family protein|nr:cupin domain-containing protein [Usitatibacter sp.]
MKARAPLILLAACAAAVALAQAPAIKRTILQRGDVGADREAVLGVAEIAAGGSTGRHSHPGIETGYVLEGTTVLTIDGEAPRTLKAGESYFIPAGRIHDAKAEGGTARVIATYVVEKGKPLATPAP